MDFIQSELCRRVIDTWNKNINARINLYDKINSGTKMRTIYQDYYHHLSVEREAEEFDYSGELTEAGWEIFKEIQYLLPSYILIEKLIEDKFGTDTDNECEAIPF